MGELEFVAVCEVLRGPRGVVVVFKPCCVVDGGEMLKMVEEGRRGWATLQAP